MDNYIIIMDEKMNSPVITERGNILAYDTQSQKMIELQGTVNGAANTLKTNPTLEFGIDEEHSDTSLTKGQAEAESAPLKNMKNTSRDFAKDEPLKKWKEDEAVILLIDKWKSHEMDFKKGVLRHEAIWKIIASEMQTEGGYNYTGLQCENKFKDLRKNYMKTKDHNAQTGVAPKTCKHYEKMAAIFDEKPNVKPVSLASNRRRHNVSLEDSCSSDEEVAAVSKPKKRKATKVEKEMKAWANIMKDDNLVKREEQQKRHEENQALMSKMLEANTSFFNKLLEKL